MKLGNVLILGDSYSTFEGYIPEGCSAYYGKELHPDNGVSEVSRTWWQRLIDKTGSRLILNSSWSGTTICHTGYDKANYIDRSFVTRLDRLIEEGFFEKNSIDTVLVFGATNDNWAGAPIGELMYTDWTVQDLYSFLPACCYLFDRLREAAPAARVISILNTELKAVVVDGMLEACEHYGVQCLRLCDIEKVGGHPTAKGMEQICEQILNAI